MRRALLLVPVLVAAGCGSGSDQTREVSAAAQSYVAAFTAHDAAATCRAMTAHSRELVAEFARDHMHLLRGATCTKAVALLPPARPGAKVGDVKIAGSRATVAVDGFDRPLLLVREHGTWRVQSTPSGETD
ncbi:MAG: hypothetical protein ACXVDD_16875 [Polyangia bacterium]